MSESYLLAFHLGPIQDFIATARRTQDLWIGSWLLAHLSEKAIKTAQCKGAVLVLPKELPKSDDPAIADTPNHFLARVTEGNAADIARQVQAAVECAWFCIHRKVKCEFFGNVPDDLWTRQLQTFLEIYWAVVPDEGENPRKRAQDALDARKRLRDFRPICEPHLKCTLCGVRQELSGKTTVPEARDWWVKTITPHLKRRHLEKLRIRENGNERLCAVCAVKRAALAAGALKPGLDKYDGHFPSTSNVAAAMFKKRLLETGKAQAALEAHFQALRAIRLPDDKIEMNCLPGLQRLLPESPTEVQKDLLRFDGDLFYTETFTVNRIKEEFPETIDEMLAKSAKELSFTVDELLQLEPTYVAQQIAKAAVTLRDVFRTADIRPSKYFTALMMDGDHMGAFFGKATEEQASNLSKKVSAFARNEVKTIVEQHFGRLVYAGGDDALALLPLEEALPCARELQQKFKEAVRDMTLPEGVKCPTSSIGIAIAHHTQPLDATLSAMRDAERDAKNRYGRDALCVYVLKRSGEEVHVGTHWQAGKEGEVKVDAVGVVTDLIDLLNGKALSMRFATAVAAEARFLPDAAIGAELRRLGKRQSGENYEQHEEKVKQRLERAEKLARAIGMEEFADWTMLARFIASGGRDSE